MAALIASSTELSDEYKQADMDFVQAGTKKWMRDDILSVLEKLTPFERKTLLETTCSHNRRWSPLFFDMAMNYTPVEYNRKVLELCRDMPLDFTMMTEYRQTILQYTMSQYCIPKKDEITTRIVDHIKLWIEFGADPSYLNDDKGVTAHNGHAKTVLQTALETLTTEYVQALLDNGLESVEQLDRNGLHVFSNFVRTKGGEPAALEMIKFCVEIHGADLSWFDKNGYLPLTTARLHSDVLEYVVSKGVSVDWTGLEVGWGAVVDGKTKGSCILHMLLENNCQAKTMKMVLENGADAVVNHLDSDGRSPIYYNVKRRQQQFLQKFEHLVEHGSKLTDITSDGMSVLHAAVCEVKLFGAPLQEVLPGLLELGAVVCKDVKDKEGRTPVDLYKLTYGDSATEEVIALLS